MSHDTEFVDIVDDNDCVVETISRTELHKRGIRNFRVVSAFVKNKEGKLWMPKFTKEKKYAPEFWALVGGCVQSGESYDYAFARETKEEIGVDVSAIPVKKLGFFTPPKDDAHSFKMMYEIELDTIDWFDNGEFASATWMWPQEVLDLHARGENMLRDIPWMVKRFYL